MQKLKNLLKQSARDSGAVVVGVASRERLLQSPPSANPDYLLPSTLSAISFAVAIDQQILRRSFRRETWLEHGEELKRVQQRLYGIGDRLVDLLAERGFDALAVDGNDTYRPQKGVTDPILMTEFVPDFSHRYAAVAAGLGRLGWSGNLLTTEHGATVILGTVLTPAALEPDPLLEDNPCDGCKSCTSVCPIEMMSPRESVEVVVAGIREVIGKKQPDTRCWISCGGYQGLHKNGKWSNWSPYRVVRSIPEDKEGLDSLLIQLRKTDPEEDQDISPFTDYRETTFAPNWRFVAACGNCANVCWERRKDRFENQRLLVGSGQVVLRPDGAREPASGEIVEIDTPYGVKVAVLRDEYEQGAFVRQSPDETAGYTFMDTEVLKHLASHSPLG
ncbi:hypothetical protein ACFLUT_01610 [Chloroflexota bacterium]